MAEQWELLLNQAMPEMVKEVVDATIYKRLWLAMLQNRGKIKTGVPGSYAKKRPIDWKEVPILPFTHGTNPNYAPRDYLKWTEMGWKGSYATDSMDYIEYKEIAHSPNTIVDRYTRIIPKLLQGLKNYIGLQLYADSNATGHENDFDGLETACGTIEAHAVITDATCDVADLVAIPSCTYQGVSTALGQAGTWSTNLATKPNATINTDWPEGTGSSEYAYRSPKLVNWSSSSWGTSKVTWEANCQRALSRTAMWIRNTYGGEGNGSSLMGMLSTDLMSGFKNALRSSNLILTPHREAETLGFGDVLNFEGVGLSTEYGCPANTAYMLDMDDVTVSFLGTDMIETFGPFKESDMLWKWNAIVLGNIELNPRRLAKLHNYAAA
jgi:hypothetical protein